VFCLAGLLAFACWQGPSSAHVGRHGPQDKHAHAAPRPLTQEQLARRFEKIKQRAASRKLTRSSRARDRRRALQNRLKRLLRGSPLSANIRAELGLHARRVAHLRRIRLLAAEAKDKDSVLQVDKVLARENQRHERWWRSFREERQRREKKGAKRP
jgi:hypothetical protein